MEAEKDRLHSYYKEDSLKEPSTDFTKQVMDRVEAMATAPFVVKPLIAKKGWLYIILGATIVVFGTFALELLGAIQDIPKSFKWPDLNLRHFSTSIAVGIVVTALLIVLTAADIVYRRLKDIF